jgi:hypothetical protein
MRTGEVEANLLKLNEQAHLSYIDELVARKLGGPEQGTLPDNDFRLHEAEYARLRGVLDEAYARSTLPEGPSAKPALNDLLVRLRTAGP